MNVLSLFDGMSCGQIALERAGIKVDNYFASEIDKHAIKVTQANYPNTIQLGDITAWHFWDLPKIDLILMGTPCQDISNLNNKQLGLKGEKSSLFFIANEVLKYYKPNYFLCENVCGKKESMKTISKYLGVDYLVINSNLLTAQNRKRAYWTNIPGIEQPKNKGILLNDILDKNVEEKYFLKDGRLKWFLGDSGKQALKKRYINLDGNKSQCLTARGEPSWNCQYVTDENKIRKLTPNEWEKLQTVPSEYTNHVSNPQRYKMLGNGWTVDIIAHILRGIK